MDGSEVSSFVRRGEWRCLPKALDSDPSHEASQRRKATLLGVRRHSGQLEHLIGHQGIQRGWGNLGPSIPSGLREAAAKRLEPCVHVEANRITNRNFG